MKKKLTLNQAWSKCLKQWKYIVENLDSGEPVYVLKEKYIEEHESEYINANCYFCEYNVQHRRIDEFVCKCKYCPGKLVNRRFSCDNVTYHYHDKPRAFYKKLLALNAKRKAKKQVGANPDKS